MKMLLFLAREFAFRPHEKRLADVDDSDAAETVRDTAVVFVHTEPGDLERRSKVVTRAAKNIKWLCGKVDWRRVVLHSFNHLAVQKSPPEDARTLLADIAERLRSVDYEVFETPFGYVCEWELSVIGPSLGKVFKEV